MEVTYIQQGEAVAVRLTLDRQEMHALGPNHERDDNFSILLRQALGNKCSVRNRVGTILKRQEPHIFTVAFFPAMDFQNILGARTPLEIQQAVVRAAQSCLQLVNR